MGVGAGRLTAAGHGDAPTFAPVEAAAERAARLSVAQGRVLELAVGAAPLVQTLTAIIEEVEALSPSGVLASILLLDADRRHVRHGAAPSLPEAYNRAIDGIEIGEGVGSCGTALHRNEPVFVTDIATDPLWVAFRDLALAHNLRACWSIPIRAAGGEPLGTFAMYHREPREPEPGDLEIVEFVVRTAALVIERARTEATLRASEARYRQIVEGAEDFAIVTLDAHGTITAWNTGAERIVGWAREEAIGRSGAIIFTPEDCAAATPDHEMNRASSHGRALDERWHLRKDRSRFWGSGLMMPLPTEAGGYVKLFRDRTVEHEAEAAIQVSEARYRTLFEAIDEGFYRLRVIVDGDGRCTDAIYVDENPAATRITGQSFLGRTLSELGYEDPFWRELFGRVARTGEAERFEREDAGAWFDLYAFKPAGAPDDEMAVVFRDVTARRRAEAELRENNETLERRVESALAEGKVFADMIESSSSSTMAVGLDHRILAINSANVEAFERIYGVRPKAGDNLFDLLSDLPEHHRQVTGRWERGLAGEEYMFTEEFGDEVRGRISYEVRFSPLRDRAGRLIGAASTAVDVTEKVRAQASLEAAQEALRQAQKMEATGQLTGGVAHDFNNLLTPIVGALDLLARQRLGGEREQRLIAGAAQSAERARTLVQRLLAYARRQPLQAVPVDISGLIRGMGDLIASTTGPQIRVAVDAPDDLPSAQVDANQLEMALLNLAVNARDAMPEGGTLRISAAAEWVGADHRAGVEPGTYVLLSVADTGTGMDQATIARAVEPFFSTKGLGRGTGLGLSMVHGLASQLGGALTIKSRPGLGTTMELWLPVSGAAAAPSALAGDRPVAVLGRGTALLVDDEAMVRMSTADMLAELGYDVVEAASAEEALRLVAGGGSFDLLVSDHLMPGMTGTELVRTLRGQMVTVPALLISGYAEGVGVDPDLARLVKPFRQDELATAIARLEEHSALL